MEHMPTRFTTERSARIGALISDLYDHLPEIEADRAELVAEAYKATESLPVIRRRSAVFAHILKNLPVTIRRGELIVGSNAKTPRGCPTFPEYSWEWLEPEFDTIATREADPFYISEETKARLRAVHPYFKGKTTNELATAFMDEKTYDVFMNHGIFTVGNYFYNGVGHICVDYGKVIAIGYEGIKKEAEALRIATAAEAVQAAKAKQEAYIAQQEAEQTRAQLEMATQQADVIVKAQIAKEQAQIAADAEAEVARRKAQGEADAIFAKMAAEARGTQEILEKQAEGMRKLVEAAGGSSDNAVKLILADKMEQLLQIQVEAIKNIKIDKVTVWDGGKNGDGKTATSGFLSGMMQAVPPLNEVFKQVGMELPTFLGKEKEEAAVAEAAAKESAEE